MTANLFRDLPESFVSGSLPELPNGSSNELAREPAGETLGEVPWEAQAELLSPIANGNRFRVERIVSRGQCSPAEFWYDQEEHELVFLLAGSAGLEFESPRKTIELGPGDYLILEAHTRHRVAWTAENEFTIWLAIFYQ